MARLPVPGSDKGNWGSVLNEFLSVALNSDGTIKNEGIIASKYTKPASGIPRSDLSSSVQASLDNADAAVAGTAPNATTTTPGLVQLSGHLGGTATSPTVPGLATKANVSDVYTRAQVDSALNAKANTSSLSAVATTGNYNDLTNRPTIPAQFNPIAGTNVSLSGTYPNVTISATPGAGVTDLSSTRNATSVTVVSSTGDDAVLAAADTTNAGVMSSADKTKLNGIAANATANATDAQLRDRSTHTGSQPISSITNLQTQLDGKQPSGDYATNTALTNGLSGKVNGLNGAVGLWIGTQSEYDAIVTKSTTTLYVVSGT